jgi:hypothetical protein
MCTCIYNEIGNLVISSFNPKCESHFSEFTGSEHMPLQAESQHLDFVSLSY